MAHVLKELPWDPKKVTCVSQQVVQWHHGMHHAGYVKKRNEIEEKIEKFDKAAANANYSDWGELKRRETFNAAGMILHEIYWENMGGDGKHDMDSEIIKAIIHSFGSFEKWKEDFVATAKASLGWAILCWDPSDGKMHNFLVDFHNNGAVWGSVPLVAIDVFEHAYYHDYGPDRAKYIEAFLNNLDWHAINERFGKNVLKH